MILDMHVHTVASDDSTATITGYIDIILAYRHLHPFDGFVLTEHRSYTPGLDLQRYWDEFGVLVTRTTGGACSTRSNTFRHGRPALSGMPAFAWLP